MARHDLSGACKKCAEFLAQADSALVTWFVEQQRLDPTFHCSESYRGPDRQNLAKLNGFSRATFGLSPHNYVPSQAIDCFFLIDEQYNGGPKYPRATIVAKLEMKSFSLPKNLEWGGKFPKFDGPHFQVVSWQSKVKNYPNGELLWM